MKAIVIKNQPRAEQEDGGSAFSISFVDEEGSLILRGNRYKTKESAYKGVRAVQKNCIHDRRYIINRSFDGRYSFQIKSANGSVVVDSEIHPSKEAMQEVIDRLKAHVPDCNIEFLKQF